MTEIERLGAGSAYVLGSPSAVSTNVENALKTELGSGNVTRLAGDNRYSTARAIAAETVDVLEAGPGYDGTCFIATGTNFPDALAGGVLQGKDGSVMLLTPGTMLDAGVRTVLVTNKASIDEVRFLGGTSAVGTAVRTAVSQALQ
jgi:hypothetical protein